MTPPEAVAYLQRFTYKPNFTLLFNAERLGGLSVYIKARVPNSRPGAKTLVVSNTARLDMGVTILGREDVERWLTSWLQAQLEAFERHELAEWFRRDGELVKDPHAEDP